MDSSWPALEPRPRSLLPRVQTELAPDWYNISSIGVAPVELDIPVELFLPPNPIPAKVEHQQGIGRFLLNTFQIIEGCTRFNSLLLPRISQSSNDEFPVYASWSPFRRAPSHHIVQSPKMIMKGERSSKTQEM